MRTLNTKFADVKPGDKLKCDDGFTCMEANSIHDVKAYDDDVLYVDCSHGRHCILGQIDTEGFLVGLEKV